MNTRHRCIDTAGLILPAGSVCWGVPQFCARHPVSSHLPRALGLLAPRPSALPPDSPSVLGPLVTGLRLLPPDWPCAPGQFARGPRVLHPTLPRALGPLALGPPAVPPDSPNAHGPLPPGEGNGQHCSTHEGTQHMRSGRQRQQPKNMPGWSHLGRAHCLQIRSVLLVNLCECLVQLG